ncbi:MAG: CBS domain-containing protein [Candidatus Woesearchaeota archaeon]|jgi:CBS domain-containing protein|nr:CBS domain-containing protein [Candidatus Woesearchaeota archaeon]
MKVSDIMTKIIKTSSHATISEAAKLMDSKNIGSLLVEEDSRITGIITERDILKKIVAKDKDPRTTSIKEVMRAPIITISSDQSIEEANDIMIKNQIRRLPVESAGTITGMITSRDVSKNLKFLLGRKLTSYNRTEYKKD